MGIIQKIKRILGIEVRDKRAEIYEHPERKKAKEAEEEERQELLQTIEKNEKEYSNMPYVWGGNSPSGFVQRFVKGKLLGKKQPPGSWRQGQPLEAGFDCSGWVQYNLKKAGYDMPGFKKIGCRDLDRLKTDEGEVIEIAKKAKPGDIIVFKKKGKDGQPEHVAFYLGKGKISESSGSKKVDPNNPYLEDWKAYAHPGEHGKTNEDMGGVQENEIDRYQGKFVAELVPLSKLKKKS